MSEKEKNDFWDISSLVPKKRPPLQHRERDVEAVTIDIDAVGTQNLSNAPSYGGRLSARFREVTSGADANISRNINVNININQNRNVNIAGSAHRAADADDMEINDDIEINIDTDNGGGNTDRSDDRLRLPKRENVARASRPTAEPIDEYEPEGGLIKRVRIMQWPSRYSFYEQFRFDAKRYADVKGHECAEVDFFSYTPQYRQMSKTQLEYYFWWRENARRGVWLPASFSYVLLYVYEIINLRGVIPPEDGVHSLCAVWIAYRDKHKVLDKYLSEWLADYCLINRQPVPREQLAPILPAVLEAATLKEFYMTGDGDGISAETWMDLSSDYHWQKSKFALEEKTANDYKRHMPAAVGYVIERRGDLFSGGSMREAVVSRDAFCGSLCAHNVKCRIDIEYLSHVRSRELRSTLTEIVKYAENRLRFCLGIKARLRVGGIPDDIKALVDEYFTREFPETAYQTKKAARAANIDGVEGNDYDGSMYDALSVGIDPESAAELERASWASTELLTDTEVEVEVDEMTDDAAKEEVKHVETTAPDVGADNGADSASDSIFARLDEDAGEFLRLVMANGDQSAFCRERGLYADEVASRINDVASDIIGDIILEAGADGSYTIIEDYIDDIK